MNSENYPDHLRSKKHFSMIRRIMVMSSLFVAFATFTKAEVVSSTKSNAFKNHETSIQQQKKRITGTITDAQGQAVIGANVIEEGSSNGTVTDANGHFSLEVANDAQIRVSYIGFLDQVVNASGNSDFRITLNEDVQALSEVVVVAYGEQKRSTLTNAQSTISNESFAAQPVMRLDQALQGRAAGVQVTNASGAPGGDVRIRIRGANSINGNNDPLYVIDGFVGGNFNALNPDDIADIQILKDAAATAPYGSRGANGVIIVTTKKGSRGKANYSFSTRLSSSSVPNRYDMLSAVEFAETANAYSEVTTGNTVFTADQINGFKSNGGTDWQNEIYQTAFAQQYEFGVNGGNDLTNYYLSLGYQDQPGVIKNSFSNFYNIRSNINVNLSDKVTTFLNLSGFMRNNQNTFMRQGTQNAVNQSIAWAPTTPVRDDQGNLLRFDPTSSVGYNPVAEIFNRIALQKNYNVNIVGGLKYRIIDPLTFNIQYGVDYGTSNYNNAGDTYVSTNGGYAGSSTGTNITLQNTNNLTYHQLFNDVHDLTLTAVAEFQKYKGEGFNAGISELIYPSFLWYNLAFGKPVQPGAWMSESGLSSLFGRVNYSYDERYMITTTIRRDASSVFRKINNASYFPSVSLGWALHNEEFIKKANIFDELKLRLSWGLTGNQSIGAYSTFSTYASQQATFNSDAGTPGIVIDRAENTNLKWETTEQKNIGLDFRLKPLSIYGTVDYFIKNTRDLLFWVGLPNYTGGGGIMKNIGEVQNKGWELTLGATPVNTRDFSWNTEFNYSSVDNKVIKLADVDKMFYDTNVGWGLTESSEFILEEGKPMAGMWGVNYLGTWKPTEAAEAAKFGNVPGDSRYEDLNGDYVIDQNDYKVIGYGLPKYTMGWNNTFNLMGVELNMLLQGVFGFDKLDLMRAAAVTSYGDIRYPTMTEIIDRYIPGQNETSDIPAFSSTNKHYVQSSRFVSKGDFLRIKNLSLAYTLPKSLLNNVAAVKLSAGVTNLYTFTKYTGMDPEISNISGTDAGQSIDYGGYPIPRTFTFGLTLTF